MTDERILAKIKKVLALTTSDNESEAATAAATAQELLLKYQVSQEELEGFELEKNEKVVRTRTEGKSRRNRVAWNVQLAHIIANSNLCELLFSGPDLIWIGKPTNIELSQYLHDKLTVDLERIATNAWSARKSTNYVICKTCMADGHYYSKSIFVFPEEALEHRQSTDHRDWRNAEPYEIPRVAHGKTWKNSFYFGANATIRERLTTNLVELKMNENINALVVANDVELKEFMNINYPKLHHVSNNSRLSDDGYSSGRAAGHGLSFGQGIGAGGNAGPKLIGGGK